MSVFNDLIKDRDVLMIPIVSMRSYETNIYDMTCDGNVQRIISTILSIPKDYNYRITIVWPGQKLITKESYELVQKFKSYVDSDKVRIILEEIDDMYPVGGASVQRNIQGAKILSKNVMLWLGYNQYKDQANHGFERKPLIIYEGDYIGTYIETLKSQYDIDTCFWCYASCTKYSKPDYIIPLEHIELELAKSCDHLMLASLGQYYYFTADNNIPKEKISINTNFTALWHPMYQYETNEKLLSYTDELIKAGFKIVFIPTRLTDKGYYAEYVLDAIDELVDDSEKVALLYSDPNESHMIENRYKDDPDHENFIIKKISRDRNTFYTMIDQVDCVVPYLEDCTEKFHTSIQEFIYFRTKILYQRMWNDDDEGIDDGIDWSVFNIELLTSRPNDVNLVKKKLLAAFNMPKKKLITIEGFDRTGKDTVLKYIEERINSEFTNSSVYIQHNYEGDDPQPNYRNKELFIPWLKRFQKAQDHELTKVYYEMLREKRDVLFMTRKYISDYVYSRLFDRDEITIKNIRSIRRYYDIVSIILQWATYDEYLKRCRECVSEVEYTQDEYIKIKMLFVKAAEQYSDYCALYPSLIFVDNSMSTKTIVEEIKKIVNNI